MHVIVLGAGVVGLCAAYAVVSDGHTVTVVDAAEHVASGASFANGGQLSYSYVAPFASPSTLAQLPWLTFGRDAPCHIHPRLDPAQWVWMARFLSACGASEHQRTTQRLLSLSALSRQALDDLLAKHPLEFGLRNTGKLLLYGCEASLAKGVLQAEIQRRLGCEQQVLGPAECLALEPTLAYRNKTIAGGVFTPSDQTADCRRFCQALAHLLSTDLGVEFRMELPTNAIVSNGSRVTGVETAIGLLTADAYILSLGMGSVAVARTAGFRLPILGLKGYSVDIPLEPGFAPQVSVTDLAQKILYSPIGNHFRISGVSDIDCSSQIRKHRVALLQRKAAEAYPGKLNFASARSWNGMRPATPSGTPLIGRSPLSNLFLNTGHGALGFTLAMGSGRVVADAIAGLNRASFAL